jgi:hypothetical protein
MVGGTRFIKSAAARSDAGTGKQWATTTINRRGEEPVLHAPSDRYSGSFVVEMRKAAAEKNPDPETSGGAWMGLLRDKNP